MPSESHRTRIKEPSQSKGPGLWAPAGQRGAAPTELVDEDEEASDMAIVKLQSVATFYDDLLMSQLELQRHHYSHRIEDREKEMRSIISMIRKTELDIREKIAAANLQILKQDKLRKQLDKKIFGLEQSLKKVKDDKQFSKAISFGGKEKVILEPSSSCNTSSTSPSPSSTCSTCSPLRSSPPSLTSSPSLELPSHSSSFATPAIIQELNKADRLRLMKISRLIEEKDKQLARLDSKIRDAMKVISAQVLPIVPSFCLFIFHLELYESGYFCGVCVFGNLVYGFLLWIGLKGY